MKTMKTLSLNSTSGMSLRLLGLPKVNHYSNIVQDKKIRVEKIPCNGKDSCSICSILARINKPKSRWQKIIDFLSKILRKEIHITTYKQRRGLL